MSRLDLIIEQTAFLVEKQKEAQRDCSMLFHDLAQTAQKRCEATALGSKERELLEYVCDLVKEQAERITEEAQVEIDYLDEQLDALQQIKAIKDPARAEEMLGEILEADAEIKNTTDFKKEVTDESLAARHNLAIVINDMKAVLAEGNADELVAYLENILEDEDDCGCENEDCEGCDKCLGDDEEDDDFDDEDEEEEDECCGSKKNKPCNSPCGSKSSCGKSKSKCCK